MSVDSDTYELIQESELSDGGKEADTETETVDGNLSDNEIVPQDETADKTEEYNMIYTEETRQKAILLLILFSFLICVLPLATMYYAYYNIFNDYDQQTDMLYSGILSIFVVIFIAALYVVLAYLDEREIEKRFKKDN